MATDCKSAETLLKARPAKNIGQVIKDGVDAATVG